MLVFVTKKVNQTKRILPDVFLWRQSWLEMERVG